MSMSVSSMLLSSGLNALTGALDGADKKPLSAVEKANAAAEASHAKSAATLDEIRKKGLYAWAQEQKFENLKAKVRAQLLDEKGLSEKDVAGMDDKSRSSFEASLQEQIAQRVKEAMQSSLEHQAKDDAKQGKPAAPMIIDISV
jgi:hypothetical protein